MHDHSAGADHSHERSGEVTLGGNPIKEVDERIWLVSFIHYDLGYIDLEQTTLQPLDNPFGPRLSPMSQEHAATQVSGSDIDNTGAPERIRTSDPQIRSVKLAVRQTTPNYEKCHIFNVLNAIFDS